MEKTSKVKYLMILIAIFILITIISNNFNVNTQYLELNKKKSNVKRNGSWIVTSTIHIDDSNPSINWSKIAADNPWCSGTGAWNDPYLIENVTIDGLFEGSCIYIENSNVPFIIRNCTLVNIGRGANPNYDSGVRLDTVTNGLIINNSCSFNNGRGIYLLDSSNNTIYYNKANYNVRTGIYVYTSNNNTIFGNTFNYNDDGGIYIYQSNYNNFSENVITHSISDISTREIELTGQNNIFSGNIFNNCSIHLREGSLNALSSHQIDTTNLVNGKPIYYYANTNNLNKENFSNAGQVILVGCYNCEISGLNMAYGGPGISLYHCDQNTVFNNTISFHFREHIQLYSSYQNNISYNIITNIGTSRGINLRYSDYNNISSNQIADCNTAIEVRTSFRNTISNNYLNDNYRAIYIQNGEIIDMYNVIRKNIISNNSEGLYITSPYSKLNTIYLNYFINNGLHASNNGDINYWDNGSIGNYWDDYNGNDTNDDGIGETPYNIPGTAGGQDNFPLWDDGHNGSKIIIDDSASNNWNWARKHTWCSGSGTFSDPYIILEANINGNNTGSCIYIKNSNVYFIIESCTVYNSQSLDDYHAGIRLEDSTNGMILNSNSSNNNGHGIVLDGCSNFTIQGCDINDNSNYGICQIWSSHTISIINNAFKNNDRGIFISSDGRYDKIFDNTFESNSEGAVYINPGSFSDIQRNKITGSYEGIHLWGNNNTISFNNIYNNGDGISLINGVDTWNNTIANNSIYNNGYGINVEGANCRYNMFYNNSLIGNDYNAQDDGYSNYWNNSLTGNYWDNYNGVDTNDDGIGDDPYIISGLANSQDYIPIWWDAPIFRINSPSLNENFGNSAPSYNISMVEGVADIMWYTLDNGITNTTFISLTGMINPTVWFDTSIGSVLIRFYVNDSRGYISVEEVNVNKNLEYWTLTSFIIDDTGGGNYTWAQAISEQWCYGTGTLNDPFRIKYLKINGQISGSCLIIRNSSAYFRIQDCNFYNSGSSSYDAGVKLYGVLNGEVISINCSYNNGNGLVLDSCQYINILSSTFNNNTLSGILLIDSNYVEIYENIYTINSNDYGIYLLRSHHNTITGNNINFNRVGIFLDDSNYNSIDWNNLLGNGQAIVDEGTGNIIGENNILPEPSEYHFPFEILLIILIIVVIIIVGVSSALVIRKRRRSKV